LLLLLGALIVISTIVLFATLFRTAINQANKLFDYHMQQIALALQDSNFDRIELSAGRLDENMAFDFVIQIWNEDGVQVYESRKHRFLPGRAAIGYSTVNMENGEWVVYAVHTNNRVIQVTQQMKVRHDRAIKLILYSLWPIIPTALILMGAIWWVVSRAMMPLNRISSEIGNRNAAALEPVSEAGLPSEVVPLVSELNSLFDRLSKAMGLQQQFVADAAHELRSPLTALKLQVQTLERAKDETARAQAIARLVGGIERAIRLVEQLLALARQDPLSRSPFDNKPVLLSACACDAMADVSSLASSKGIDLLYKEQAQIYVHGDPENIRILIRNIVDNAVRYTPSKGIVEVVVDKEENNSVVIVSDSGSGIPEEEKARIFDRFYRVPGTYPMGSGLGLPIVKAIAEHHSATIVLERATLGGLAFKVRFPSVAA